MPGLLRGVARKGTLYVAGTCVVPFDEIAVVRVHHAHERGQVRRGVWMKPQCQGRTCSGQLRDHVGNGFARLVEPCRLNALGGLYRRHLADLD